GRGTLTNEPPRWRVAQRRLHLPGEPNLRPATRTVRCRRRPVQAEAQLDRPRAARDLEHDVPALAAGGAEEVEVVGEQRLRELQRRLPSAAEVELEVALRDRRQPGGVDAHADLKRREVRTGRGGAEAGDVGPGMDVRKEADRLDPEAARAAQGVADAAAARDRLAAEPAPGQGD